MKIYFIISFKYIIKYKFYKNIFLFNNTLYKHFIKY